MESWVTHNKTSTKSYNSERNFVENIYAGIEKKNESMITASILVKIIIL